MNTLSFFLCFFCFIITSLFSESLKEKFLTAEQGSYIAFENQNTISCLIFHSIKNDKLYLYEISFPSSHLKEGFDLKKWLLNKAEDSSSFVIYSINMNSNTIEDCFSFTRKSYINISDQGSFLPKLLKLELKPVADDQRKKIALKAGEIQEKPKFWNPPKIVEGCKIQERHFDVFKTSWPLDDSELSNKPIVMYFDKENKTFPFPYWIEIGQGHICHKLRAKDSGILDSIPFKFFPAKPITVAKVEQTEGLTITLLNASNYETFHIMATSSFSDTHETHLIKHNKRVKDHKTILSVSEKHLKDTLEKGMEYHLCIFPEDHPSEVIELKKTYKY